MGKIDDSEGNQPPEEIKETSDTQAESRTSGFELLEADHAATQENLEANANRIADRSEQMYRTSEFGRADSTVHAEAAKVGQLFTPANKEAIVSNIPE